MVKPVFPGRESKFLEFKSTIPKFDTLIKTCIAFANASGGQIIIGVEDENHEIIGISDADRRRIYDDFSNSLYDSTSPSLIAQIYEQNFGELSVLIIEVPVSPRKPYFLKRKGMAGGTYIRVGSSTRKATGEYIEDLIREAQRLSYDEEAVNQNINILSNNYLQAFIEGKVTKRRLQSEHIITTKVANKDDFVPTVAGVLMFCENPHDFIPEALVRCTRFKGTVGRDILQTEDICGVIENQASQTLKLINTWLVTHYELQGVRLKQQQPIPIEALREAILNALLHRKYNIVGAVKVAVYDNRVEIFSPGCFPGLVDVDRLGDGTTFLRNPRLVRLAYQINLIETRGTGIRLIFDSCQKAGIKKPEFSEEGDFVKVVFNIASEKLAYKNSNDAILAFVKLHRTVSAQEIAAYLSVSHNTAIRKLSQLIEKNKLRKVGRGPATKYVIAQ